MWRYLLAQLLIIGWAPSLSAAVPQPPTLAIVSYHEIVDEPNLATDRYATSTRDLVAQLAWLHEHGYTVVSLDQVINAWSGKQALPEKAVLLTFDEGYASTYSKAFPLLKAFHYPAVVSLAGRWMETKPGDAISHDDQTLPRERFLAWAQVREMVQSGLVSVASHSFDLHRAIVGNPQGDLLPAATARIFGASSRRYENDTEYRARINADLARNAALIERETGIRPRVMVWPHGSHNRLISRTAAELGMDVQLTWEPGRNQPGTEPLGGLRRMVMEFNPGLPDFISALQADPPKDLRRVVRVDLDSIYAPEEVERERNLSRLAERIAKLGVNTVYLKAFASPQGDGVEQAVYFPNRHLPMRTDLFARAAWQLKSRAGVEVFAWMPVPDLGVPENPLARRTILDIYEDLSKHAQFSGLFFDSDATSPEFDLTSPAALDAIEFTRALTLASEMYRGPIKTARSLYADPRASTKAKQSLAAALGAFQKSYDQVVVIPGQASNTELKELVTEVAAHPAALSKVIFELSTVDGKNKRPVSSSELARKVRTLRILGALHIGYSPDNAHKDQPALASLQPVMSLQAQPR